MQIESKHKFTVIMISLSRTIEMEFASSDLDTINALMWDFVLLFSKEIDYENKKINIDMLQKNTEALRESFKKFVDKYKSVEPKVNQLNTY